MKKIKVELSQDEINTIIFELRQGIYGDKSAYDKKLEKLATKLEGAKSA